MNHTENLIIKKYNSGAFYRIETEESSFFSLGYDFPTKEEAEAVLDSWRNADKVAKERDEYKEQLELIGASTSNLFFKTVIQNTLNKYK